jgi:hypothetical protein
MEACRHRWPPCEQRFQEARELLPPTGMARSAALQSRRTAEAGARVSAVPERVELRIVHPYRRREPKTPYLLITVEWVVLTTIGAVALALATG